MGIATIFGFIKSFNTSFRGSIWKLYYCSYMYLWGIKALLVKSITNEFMKNRDL